MKRRYQQKGFTLIELIIYIALVGVILVSLSLLALEILGGQSRSYARQEVVQNSRFIVSEIKKDIAKASSITSISTSTLQLFVPNSDSITFSFASSTLTKTEGAGTPIVLHADDVEVAGEFIDLSINGRTQHVGITVTTSFINPDDSPDFNASSTVDFSMELRGRK